MGERVGLRAGGAAFMAVVAAMGCSRPAPTTQVTAASKESSCTFTNPVAPGADPWIIRSAGRYHLVQSQRGAIWVYTSDSLTAPRRDSVRVWSAPASGWNEANVWAPELHLLNGRWYIYYTAGRRGPADSPFIHQRSGVLESSGADPRGPYADRGMLYTGDDITTGTGDTWAIDLTVHAIAGQLYAVWSGWERNTTVARTPQHLYIARMSNPWTIGGNRVKLSSPDEAWERGTELDLQEAPQFLAHDDQMFVIYSTRESWLKEYRLGELRLRARDADPMLSASWIKRGPVFAGTPTVFGVGHPSFTTSPDGSEPWIVYHSKVSAAPGWDRHIRMQSFGWNADGSPRFGEPASSGQRLAVPSGQCR